MPVHDHPLVSWFREIVPDGWFSEPIRVEADRDEVLVIGTLPLPALPPGAGPDDRIRARVAVVTRFRAETRAERMAIATVVEARLATKVSWAVVCDGVREVFTTVSVPVMTRLRMDERAVLDTLVDASVARSRSEALAWCVRLVAEHQGEWIAQLRAAMVEVERIRRTGPGGGAVGTR